MNAKRTIQEVRDIVDKYNKSGLSKNEFCAKNKLSPITFYKWLRKTNNLKKNLNFVPVSIKSSKDEDIQEKIKEKEKIILKTTSGISIEFSGSVSVLWLSSLLKELV